MKYLIPYLAIGVALLATAVLQHLFEKRRSKASDDVADLLAQVQGKPSLAKRVIKTVIRPLLGGALIITVWPLIIIFVVIKMLLKARQKKASEPQKFAVSNDDLDEKISIAEIEQRELVTDPLKAVPNLPFGHLHSTWVAFRDSLDPDAELWSFTATWTSDWRGEQRMVGYVSVLGDRPGAHYITMQKSTEENED
jgi:hypothetical protein